MKVDVVIIGGGPGGAASSMFLAREGIQPAIIEKVRFPRYHIGESMTGEAGGILRELGFGERMLQDRHPIKHGVKVYGTGGKNAWFVPVMARDAAWNLQEQFTWQVRRSHFDNMMLDEALARGATLIPGQAIKPLLREDGSVRGIRVRMEGGGVQDIEAELVLDCSGQATFLANHGVTGPKYLGAYDKQIAIFSQVTDFICDEGAARDEQKGNTLIFYQKKYHWAWAIPLDDEVVSVGVVIPAAYFLEKKESKRDFLIRELSELNPELARRIPEFGLVEDVHVIPNYSYQVKRFTGRGYICIGDAHRFIDPIFSFGLVVTMMEAKFAAPVVRAYLEGVQRDDAEPFAEHQVLCEQGIDVLEDAIDTFWENPIAFALLTHRRYLGLMTDIFAGRVYDHQPSEVVTDFRSVLGRERSYDHTDDYSVPIGSRYHPERSPLWEANSPIEGTEDWTIPR